MSQRTPGDRMGAATAGLPAPLVVDLDALDAIASDDVAAAAVTFMVDDPAQAARDSRAAAAHGRALAVCLDVTAPLRLRLAAAGHGLAVGDRVWFRHAKAGEVMERFTDAHLVRSDRVVRTVPTYRGEGRSSG